MSTLEAAVAIDTPQRAHARFFLALANAAMAAVVGGLTLGPLAAVAGGLAMLVLAYLPYVLGFVRELPRLIRTNRIVTAGTLFIVVVVAGTVAWGIMFPFAIALVLAPVMLVTVCILARANSLVD